MNQKSIRISAVVLARNEEARLRDCLKSLSWVDEIIVIDNGSSDQTAALARRSGARVVHADDKDFAHLRTIGMQEARGQWILYIDADERVSEQLEKEIEAVVQRFSATQSPHGYAIKRKNFYFGREWPYQDALLRLFFRSSLRGWQGELHETAIVHGPVTTLSEPLIHYTHRTLEEMIEKTNEWSRVEAVLRIKSDHPPVVWWRLLRVMMTGFLRSYIGQGGWKAGTIGWIESIYQAFSMFITYAKLWELQENKSQ